MMNRAHSFYLIAVIAGVTTLLRFLPFLIFRRHTPAVILYLGKVLPYAMMGMLAVYCLKTYLLQAVRTDFQNCFRYFLL